LQSNPDLVIVSPRSVSATLKGFFLGSGSLGARGRVPGPPAGGGWRRCHSAPLENRTLCFAPLATTAKTTPAMTTTAMTTSAMTTSAMTTSAMTTTAIPLRAPGDGEQQSFPPPAGRHGGLSRPRLFTCYSTRDNAHRYAGKLWGPGGCL